MKYLFAGAVLAAGLVGCGSTNECGLSPQCADLTSYFHCQGREVVQTSCTGAQLCSADETGQPKCVAGFEVKGTATYGKRAATAQGLAAAVQTPVPNASCSVVDEAGNVLGSGYTREDGSYTVTYQPKAGAQVHVTVATLADPAVNLPLHVNGKSGVFGYADASFSAQPSVTRNVVVSDGVSSQAFNVFTTALLAFKHLQELAPRSYPVLQYVIYPGSPGSYYQSSTNTISLLLNGNDSDGFDDAVIDHEFGHYAQYQIAMPRSEGGEHTGAPADPLLAWSEGFASYYSSSARNDSLYIDTYANPSAPGGTSAFVFDLASNDFAADPAKGMTQNISEWLVSEILWSMQAPPPSGLGKPQATIISVMGKMGNNQMDRGVFDVDLVDFLDEWLVVRGTEDCAGLKALMVTKQFPYDFAPPGHVCP